MGFILAFYLQACKVAAAIRDHGLAGAMESKDKMEIPWKQVPQTGREGDLSLRMLLFQKVGFRMSLGPGSGLVSVGIWMDLCSGRGTLLSASVVSL